MKIVETVIKGMEKGLKVAIKIELADRVYTYLDVRMDGKVQGLLCEKISSDLQEEITDELLRVGPVIQMILEEG